VGSRRYARELAFRVLFQCEASGEPYRETVEAVLAGASAGPEVGAYVRRIVETFEANAGAVERALRAASEKWKLERMAATDRSVLKLGTVEIMFFEDVPARVILDEAVEVARKFGSEESDKFVNGVLDKVAKSYRIREFS
jgi:N utilization substance protein B